MAELLRIGSLNFKALKEICTVAVCIGSFLSRLLQEGLDLVQKCIIEWSKTLKRSLECAYGSLLELQ